MSFSVPMPTSSQRTRAPTGTFTCAPHHPERCPQPPTHKLKNQRPNNAEPKLAVTELVAQKRGGARAHVRHVAEDVAVDGVLQVALHKIVAGLVHLRIVFLQPPHTRTTRQSFAMLVPYDIACQQQR